MQRRTIRHERAATIFYSVIAFFAMTTVTSLALLYALAIPAPVPTDALLWFAFALASGALTLFLPCTLPMAFMTVPIANERRTLRALGLTLLFSLGVMIVLSLYGGLFGAFGKFVMSVFPSEALVVIVPWVYLLAGIFAYALSLGELGLLSLRMPAYAGPSPEVIRKKRGGTKMFFLGLFLGNVGVGCPFPGIPLLILVALLSANPYFGALLFLVHAVGRVLPLLILLALSTIGVSGLDWIVARKERAERFAGWFFVAFSSFLITLGTYSHSWLYASGLYSWIERFRSFLGPEFSLNPDIPSEPAILGDAAFGTSALVVLLLVPLWWSYFRARKAVEGDPLARVASLESRIERLLEEARGHEAMVHAEGGKHHERIRVLDERIEGLLAERRILEEAMRYGLAKGVRTDEVRKLEEESLALRRNLYLAITVILVSMAYLFFAT